MKHTLPDSSYTDYWDCLPRLTVETDQEICINYTVIINTKFDLRTRFVRVRYIFLIINFKFLL